MESIIEHIKNGNFIVGFFALISVAGACYVLITKRIIYAAFGLLVCFLGVAGLFAISNAEFLAASQIMIYIGGILVLIIFSIMLSQNLEGNHNHENPWVNITISIFISLILVLLVSNIKFDFKTKSEIVDLKKIGLSLVTNNVLSLELVGMLLLMALIGATFIAKKND